MFPSHDKQVTNVKTGTCTSSTISYLYAPSSVRATVNSASSNAISFNLVNSRCAQAGRDSRGRTICVRTIPAATSYTIQQSKDPFFNNPQTIATLSSSPSLPYIANSLQENKKYYYRVQAKNTSYTSPWSSIASATTASSTIAAPSTPTVTQNTVGNNTTYSWNTASCASGYTTAYQYQYVITPAGYDSGWRTIKTNHSHSKLISIPPIHS